MTLELVLLLELQQVLVLSSTSRQIGLVGVDPLGLVHDYMGQRAQRTPLEYRTCILTFVSKESENVDGDSDVVGNE